MFDAIFHNNSPRDNEDAMTGIIYVRKSSEKGDSNTSLSTQRDRCLDLAEQQGIFVPDGYVYADNFTGMTLARPEFNKVMRLLRERKATALIVHTPDRLTRVPHDGSTLRNEFKRLGIRLFIYTRGEIQYSGIYEAFNYMQDAASEDWRNNVVEATNRGKKAVLDANKWLGLGTKFGYKRIGKDVRSEVIIVEEEAKLVRYIFDLFVIKRLPALEIAHRLNAEGIPTRGEQKKEFTHTSGNWRPENIYQILKNETYCNGIMYADKWKQIIDPDGKKRVIQRPKEEWRPIDTGLPIISRAIFEKAQEMLADGRSKNARTGTNEYLIGRRVYCAVCGYKMIGKPAGDNRYNYLYYRCPTRDSKYNNRACDNKMFHADQVDAAVWNWLAKLVQNPRAIIAAYKETQREIDADLQDTVELVAAYERSLKKYNSDLSDMADLYKERLITKEIFREKKILLDQQILEAQKRLREAEDHLNQRRITDADLRRIDTITKAIRNKIQRKEHISLADKQQLIDDLQITFKLGIEHGRKVVLVYWAIYETVIDLAEYSSTSPACEKLGKNSKVVLVFTIPLEN